MNKFVASGITTSVLCVLTLLPASVSFAADPSYYVKKATWQETMRESRQVLLQFETQQAARHAERLKEYGIDLGPWHAIGPFTSPNADPFGVDFGPERQLDLEKAYDNGRLKWTERPDWQDGKIHTLSGHAPSGEGLVVADYMYREIKAAKDVTLPVYLGSNDGIQVWFNNEKVLAKDIGRTAAPDQDVINLNFRKGLNTFLMKVNNRAAAHAFYFSMHPGGGERLTRLEELWRLLRRNFADPNSRRQMNWEREDKIWPGDPQQDDAQFLTRRLAEATPDIASFERQAGKLADTAQTWDDLSEVRRLYYRAKEYQQLLTDVKRKVDSITSRFAYLDAKYALQKKDDPEWQKARTNLETLALITYGILGQARAGNTESLADLPKLEKGWEKVELKISSLVPPPPEVPRCVPFDLKNVRLLDGPFKDAMERDRKYLHDLDPDRLLHMFRVTAGLPSSAESYGGWEKRELRGHTLGHFLSACALIYASTGDEKLKSKADTVVAELAKCQKAFGNGYLSAFPEEGIKRVIYSTGNWWAPWYTLHKIIAGLIEMYSHCGNEQALEIAKGMAAWTKSHLDNLNEQQTQRMLEVEFGGMNEVFCNLYAITKEPDHLTLARRFDHKAVLDPLSNFQDKLTGLHVNTQIPKIIGAAREYELTSQPCYYNITTFFWDQVVNARSYCTGGTSNHEHWRTEPHKLAAELGPATQETCCTYNMLKLTRHLFCWHPEAKYADYYERALYNSILSTQDPNTGMMMYFVPLGSGYYKIFNTPCESFWCCTGTGLENHAKYGDSIYFHGADTLHVNLFIASELTWHEKSFRLRQHTNFPEQDHTTLIVKTEKPVKLTLRVRVPYWAAKGLTVKLNGQKQDVSGGPASYLTLNRTWQDGDKLRIEMPMSLHLHRMPDDPNLAAIMYGPLVLAGELGSEGIDPKTIYVENQGVLRGIKPPPAPHFVAGPCDPDTWIKPVLAKPLTFRTVNVGKPNDVTLVPYYKLFGRRYAIYWRIQPPAEQNDDD